MSRSFAPERSGPIKEIHVWTDRPIWPQGLSRFKETPGIPNHVRWYEFLGAAPDRPYHPDYQPFNWRGWLDFGTGALGDMACHTINIACMALELFDPESVEIIDTSGIVDHETYPRLVDHPHPVRPAQPPRSPVLDLVRWRRQASRKQEALQGTALRREGSHSRLLLVGEKGSFFSQSDYGAEHVLLPREKFKDYQNPKPVLPRSPGHFTEFVEAIKSGDPTQGDVELRVTPAA